MKIYDCFLFHDESMLLDLRFNVLNDYVDKFVITESTYLHNGLPKKLNFNISNDFQNLKKRLSILLLKTYHLTWFHPIMTKYLKVIKN